MINRRYKNTIFYIIMKLRKSKHKLIKRNKNRTYMHKNFCKNFQILNND